jgi:hypothetical protein
MADVPDSEGCTIEMNDGEEEEDDDDDAIQQSFSIRTNSDFGMPVYKDEAPPLQLSDMQASSSPLISLATSLVAPSILPSPMSSSTWAGWLPMTSPAGMPLAIPVGFSMTVPPHVPLRWDARRWDVPPPELAMQQRATRSSEEAAETVCNSSGRKSRQHGEITKSSTTTVCFQNLPNDYSTKMCLELLDENGFKDRYDFIYVHSFPSV